MSGQSGPRSNGNEEVLRIPQSPNITGTSTSDCLVSYPGHSLGWGSCPSAEVQSVYSTVPGDWDCRIHRLDLYRGVRPATNECPGYDTKQSDGEVPVMLELWGMRSTSSLRSLSGSFWGGVIAPDRILSMGQIELNSVLMLSWIVWNGTFWHWKLCLH